ncbi:hypothetical protein [Haloarcula litorea]|uniref:hypothetical protein n=1 Tax=Haloarcula litorea TaxID=3032579 RepID=UPI0023E81E31|nr:hypothetical protein [Halomicroarcula sp. GDY20]
MGRLPAPTRTEAAALGTAVLALFVGYVLVPDRTVQYGAWLVVFCVWMAWFVAAGARLLYDE